MSVPNSFLKTNEMTPTEFLSTYAPVAVLATAGTPLFPSITLAQAILESGWGKSSLTTKHNNFFGIKAAGGWQGKTVNMSTGEVFNGSKVTIKSDFRAYDSPLESFKDRVKFLTENTRYKANGVFDAQTPEEQAYALKRAGYATATNYAETLIGLINQYNLKQYDTKAKQLALRRKIAGIALVVIALLILFLFFKP